MEHSDKTATAERLINSAERLFAEKGLAATSLREITTDAEANLASVSYHFGSKEGLLKAVLGHRITPVDKIRQQLFRALEERDTPPTVEEILDAFLRPIFEQEPTTRRNFTKLMSRLHHSPDKTATGYMAEFVGPSALRLLAALGRALPGIPMERVGLRTHFMIGATLHSLSEWDMRECIPELPSHTQKGESVLEELVQFAAAGFTQLVLNPGTHTNEAPPSR